MKTSPLFHTPTPVTGYCSRYTREKALEFASLFTEADARRFYLEAEELKGESPDLFGAYSARPLFYELGAWGAWIADDEIISATISAARVLQLALTLKPRPETLEDGAEGLAAKTLSAALEGVTQDEYMQCRVIDTEGGPLMLSVCIPDSIYFRHMAEDLSRHDEGAYNFKSQDIADGVWRFKPPRRKDPTDPGGQMKALKGYKQAGYGELLFVIPQNMTFQAGEWSDAPQPENYARNDAAVALFYSHMKGIRVTLDWETHAEARQAESGLALVWWHIADMQQGRRVGRCEACGKFYIEHTKRGNPQRFCSDACRVWKTRHPGETRSPR